SSLILVNTLIVVDLLNAYGKWV
ncbi:hypothetical protein SSYM_0630, partial [Serratia symbiotica str. Tucson]